MVACGNVESRNLKTSPVSSLRPRQSPSSDLRFIRWLCHREPSSTILNCASSRRTKWFSNYRQVGESWLAAGQYEVSRDLTTPYCESSHPSLTTSIFLSSMKSVLLSTLNPYTSPWAHSVCHDTTKVHKIRRWHHSCPCVTLR